MRRTRSKQIMTIAVIMVAVVGLSIGFAVFSANLTIQPGANVTPNESDFKVVFSSSASGYATDPIAPVVSPSGEFEATNATISKETPTTISNLSATFTEPGQSATYTFWVRNDGKYDAWLHKVRFGSKTCVAGTDNPPQTSLMNAACEDIDVVVTIPNSYEDCEFVRGVGNDCWFDQLDEGQSLEINVTIKYADDGARADGDFSVNFDDIKLEYSTIQYNTPGNFVG